MSLFNEPAPLFGAFTDTSIISGDAFLEAWDRELVDYDTLVSQGGRPSHPRELVTTIVEAPGEYRDILTYWQDSPDNWKVFSEQRRRWQQFQEFQLEQRDMSGRFPKHAEAVDMCLARNHFQYPASVASASAALRLNPSVQGGLGTWIEYVYYQYRKLEELQELLNSHRETHEAAMRKLLTSGVLAPHETDPDMLERLCDPAGEDMARHMVKRRFCSGDEYVPKTERLERMDKRTDAMAEFHKTTRGFRDARDRVERHGALVRWALAQVPLVEQETSGPSTFHSFMRLPVEIRRTIWLDCLPAGPSSHFFDIINHPRKPHMAHCWSSREFGVRATPARDSAYLPVYALLATCLESRLVVEAHYRQRPDANKSFEGWFRGPKERIGNFKTFDWIPAHDLIVLCFPPRQAELPSAQALSFAQGPARNVGILLTLEMYHLWGYGPDYNGGRPNTSDIGWRTEDVNPTRRGRNDGNQMHQIAYFLHHLRHGAGSEAAGDKGGGGVKTLHFIIEGMQGLVRERGRRPEDIPTLYWHVHRSLFTEFCTEWAAFATGPWVLDESDSYAWSDEDEDEERPRFTWRLGSSESQHLVEPDPSDIAEWFS